MIEKDLKVLEQYNLQIEKTYRGRGSYLCESKGKIYLLKEYHVSEEKAAVIAEIVDSLRENPMLLADNFVKNKEDKYISRDRDNVGFVLKEWCNAKECDIKNEEEIVRIVEQLARLHTQLRKKEKVVFTNEAKTCVGEFEKRIKEMKKIRNYIMKKKSKTDFELLYINCFNGYMSLAEKAFEGIKLLEDREPCLCHGDFTQHNALISDKGVYIVNFDKAHYGSQIEDLYLFMRKILEKYEWEIRIGEKLLEGYESIKSLSENDKKELYFRFMFPEKFWKISNHYYNSRKVWGVERNLQKLDKLNSQMTKRQEFLDRINSYLCIV